MESCSTTSNDVVTTGERNMKVDGNMLIDAVRSGRVAEVRAAIDRGADLAGRDDHGWSALDWAAGTGNLELIRLLLAAGVDPLAHGREGRTPYEIALAAAHLDVAQALRVAEDEAGGAEQDRRWRPYCRAYSVTDMRAFPGWQESPALDDDSTIYLHHDLSVTRGIWLGEDVVFDRTSAEWESFCRECLNFAVPDDLDLVHRAG